MNIAKFKDRNTDRVFCCPENKTDYLISLNYEYIGLTDFDKLEDKAQRMLTEFINTEFTKDFDFYKMNWLPLFTTKAQRNLFNEIQKSDYIEFTKELQNIEFWQPGKINSKGYVQALINNAMQK